MLLIAALQTVAQSCFFIHLSKVDSEPSSLRTKIVAISFALVHVIPQNVVFYFLSLMTVMGGFTYSQQHGAPTPPLPALPQLLEIIFLGLILPNFVVALCLILVIFKFSKKLKPFTKWYQPLRFAGLIIALDVLFNILTLGLLATKLAFR
jgi:hypothetical protein